MKAIWKGTIIGNSHSRGLSLTIQLSLTTLSLSRFEIALSLSNLIPQGNHYFPRSSLNEKYIKPSDQSSTHCFWKGEASYYDLVVGI